MAVLTKAQKLAKYEELVRLEAEQRAKVEALKEHDPFWFYEPSDGNLDNAAWDLIHEFLKPEDWPVKVPGQKDVHLSMAEICAASGGNQSGKTTVCAIEAFIDVIGQVPYSMREWYPKEKLPKKWPRAIRVIGQDYRNGLLLNVIPTYQRWAPREWLINGNWEDSYSHEQRVLYLQRGTTFFGAIEFMSNEQDVESFQGPKRDKMVYDEEPRHPIFKENLMRFTASERVSVLLGLTPTRGLTWLADYSTRERDESGHRIDWFKLPSVSNPRANRTVVRQILKELDYDEIKMRLLGEFVSLSGLVYGSRPNPQIHLVEPFEVRCNCGLETHKASCPASQYLVIRGIDPHLVKPTAAVWVAVDREGFCTVVDAYQEQSDTAEVKYDLKKRSEGMRLGWSVIDKSADSSIMAFGGRNIFKELTRGANAITGVRRSEKFDGSIKAGVDTIRQYLKPDPVTGVPKLRFMRTPAVMKLFQSIRTLERDTYANEEIKGEKDRIREGKHDLHAALRYVFQFPVRWYPQADAAPEPEYFDEATCS